MTAVAFVTQIISGGQTGVDRAALDAAMALGIPHGGWCPRGRRAEDGPIPTHYQVHETASSEYRVRTEQNVIAADATLILYQEPLQGGTQLTFRFCQEHAANCLLITLPSAEPEKVTTWLRTTQPAVLNVAGPRESTSPGIYAEARRFLDAVLKRLGGPD